MEKCIVKAKRKDNGEWVEGYYVPCCTGRFPCKPCIVPEPTSVWEPIEIDETTLCRFTGRTDKNTQKIFESDILEGADECFVVEWFNLFSKYIARNDNEIIDLPICSAMKIIGNRFDEEVKQVKSKT